MNATRAVTVKEATRGHTAPAARGGTSVLDRPRADAHAGDAGRARAGDPRVRAARLLGGPRPVHPTARRASPRAGAVRRQARDAPRPPRRWPRRSWRATAAARPARPRRRARCARGPCASHRRCCSISTRSSAPRTGASASAPTRTLELGAGAVRAPQAADLSAHRLAAPDQRRRRRAAGAVRGARHAAGLRAVRRAAARRAAACRPRASSTTPRSTITTRSSRRARRGYGSIATSTGSTTWSSGGSSARSTRDAEFAVTEAWIRVGATLGGHPEVAGVGRRGRRDTCEALPPPPDRYLARGRVRTAAGWQAVAGSTATARSARSGARRRAAVAAARRGPGARRRVRARTRSRPRRRRASPRPRCSAPWSRPARRSTTRRCGSR